MCALCIVSTTRYHSARRVVRFFCCCCCFEINNGRFFLKDFHRLNTILKAVYQNSAALGIAKWSNLFLRIEIAIGNGLRYRKVKNLDQTCLFIRNELKDQFDIIWCEWRKNWFEKPDFAVFCGIFSANCDGRFEFETKKKMHHSTAHSSISDEHIKSTTTLAYKL